MWEYFISKNKVIKASLAREKELDYKIEELEAEIKRHSEYSTNNYYIYEELRKLQEENLRLKTELVAITADAITIKDELNKLKGEQNDQK